MNKMKHWVVIVCLFLAACSAPKKQHAKHIASTVEISKEAVFHFDTSQVDRFEFRGELDLSKKDEDGYSMMYPGDAGIAGLLVGVVTHAVVADQMQNSKEATELEVANKVLEPLSDALDRIKASDLLGQAADNQEYRILTNDSRQYHDPNGWRLSVLPMFFVAQDYSSLRIKNVVSIHQLGNDNGELVYQNLVDIIRQHPNEELLNAPDAGDNDLNNLVAELLSESISLGLADATNRLDVEPNLRTFKYTSSGKTAYERARLVEKDCFRFVIRTLRNWIKSVPVNLSADREMKQGCDPRLGFNL